MSDHLKPEVSKGQVARLARLYHRKFGSSYGASLGVDDLEQEFWLVWHTVSRRFDPDRGFAFEAMLSVSIRNRAIELAKFCGRRRKVSSAVSIHQSIGDESSDLQIVDMLAADTETAEQTLLRKEQAQMALSKMDPRLRAMVEALQDPPPVMRREMEAMRAKVELAKKMGVDLNLPRDMNLTMMTEMFGLSRCSRYRLIDDMKEAMNEYD